MAWASYCGATDRICEEAPDGFDWFQPRKTRNTLKGFGDDAVWGQTRWSRIKKRRQAAALQTLRACQRQLHPRQRAFPWDGVAGHIPQAGVAKVRVVQELGALPVRRLWFRHVGLGNMRAMQFHPSWAAAGSLSHALFHQPRIYKPPSIRISCNSVSELEQRKNPWANRN